MSFIVVRDPTPIALWGVGVRVCFKSLCTLVPSTTDEVVSTVAHKMMDVLIHTRCSCIPQLFEICLIPSHSAFNTDT